MWWVNEGRERKGMGGEGVKLDVKGSDRRARWASEGKRDQCGGSVRKLMRGL